MREETPNAITQAPLYNPDEIEMLVTDREKLKEIQKVELLILEELERICHKHNIKYSLSGGTLLGAIRHHDFIPWDDDIDLDFRRADYYKLIKILPEELGEDFEFVPYDDFGNYFCDFISRIFYKKSETVNSFSLGSGKTNFVKDDRMNRIFIEMYCLYDTKKGRPLKKQIFKVKMIYGMAMGHRAIKTSTEKYSALQKAQVVFLSNLGKLFSMKTLFKAYEKTVNKYKDGEGDIYFKPCVPIPVIERNVFSKDLFDEYTYVDVGGKQVMAPAKYIKILELLYTNWKELPALKHRHPDHFDLESTKIWY